MKASAASTLSEHLLHESYRFILYPNPTRRTRAGVAGQKGLDDKLRQLEEWRKTFSPRIKNESNDLIDDPVLLDQLYSRERLRAVPQMVERTRKLSQLTLSEIKDQQSFVYLREAVNCYIFDLPQAAISLSRAAVEARLRTAVSNFLGKNTAGAAGLYEIINDFAVRGRLLSSKGRELANRVRVTGDEVLHKRPADSASALEVIEAARAVILEMGGR